MKEPIYYAKMQKFWTPQGQNFGKALFYKTLCALLGSQMLDPRGVKCMLGNLWPKISCTSSTKILKIQFASFWWAMLACAATLAEKLFMYN